MGALAVIPRLLPVVVQLERCARYAESVRAAFTSRLATTTMDQSNEPTLPEMIVRAYDPKQIYGERIGARRLVYLDNNVWIELRDVASQEAKLCRELCERLVHSNKVLFPLAFPSITEAIDIPDASTRATHCSLLDDLSNGVTFRTPNVLLGLEAQKAAEWFFLGRDSALDRTEVFTSVPDHLGEFSFRIPAGWPASMVRKFQEDMANEPRLRSVRFIAEQGGWKERHASNLERYVRLMQEVRERQNTRPKLPKKQEFARALQEERVELLRIYVLSGGVAHLERLLGAEEARVRIHEVGRSQGDGGPERIRALFARMPMMDQSAHMHAHDTMESSRKPQRQDFFDMDHATAPPVYADAFVTMDRRLATFVRNAKRGRATLISSLAELHRWLEALE